MTDLLTALGLVFVIEGSMLALFPEFMRNVMNRVIITPHNQLRIAGLISVIFGFTIVAVLRGVI